MIVAGGADLGAEDSKKQFRHTHHHGEEKVADDDNSLAGGQHPGGEAFREKKNSSPLRQPGGL